MVYMDFDFVISFGKYKGETIEEVFKKDASYLDWAIKNTGRLILSDKDTDKIEAKAEDEHDAWLRDNYDDEPYGFECDQYGYYGN